MLYLLFSLIAASAHAQTLYSDDTLLSNLPDAAHLQVTQSVEMGILIDEQHANMLHFCSFEDGECTPDSKSGYLWALGYSYNTQVNVNTDVEVALTRKGGSVFSPGTFYLNPGTYCLDRSESKFGSKAGKDAWVGDHYDKLRLTDCAGNPVFTLYVYAGYNLRTSEGFNGINLRDFHFQSGNVLRWVK
jgi:hypothetical protein